MKLVKPVMYSPAARPSSARAAPAKKRKQSAMGGISSDFVAPSGLPTFSDSMRASSSPCSSIALASLSRRSLRSRGVLSNHTSSYALRAAATARSTSCSLPFGTCAMTLPVAGLMISCVSPPVPGVHSPPMNISWRFNVVLTFPSLLPFCLGLRRNLAQRRAQDVESFVKVLVGDGQRHQRPDDVVVRAGAKQDEALFSRDHEDSRGLLVGGFLGCPVAHQLHTCHRTYHADIAHDVVLGLPALHALFDYGADPHRPLGQLFVAHDVHHRHAGGARDGVAAVGSAETTGIRGVHSLGAADDAGKREPGRQALCHCHKVWLHARVLDGEELAGAPEPALD